MPPFRTRYIIAVRCKVNTREKYIAVWIGRYQTYVCLQNNYPVLTVIPL